VTSDMSIRDGSSDVPPECETAISLAENLAQSYAIRGGSVTELFAAFVGVVVERDRAVGRDCLTALDRWLSGARTSG